MTATETTEIADHGPKKMLVLHIAVPGFNGDDLDEYAGYYSEPDPPTERDRLEVVCEWMRQEVGLTLVGVPGEKCMSDDFEVGAFTGQIVGAELRERPT